MMKQTILEESLQKHAAIFHKIVTFNSKIDLLMLMDFTANNTKITPSIYQDTELFSTYMEMEIKSRNALYAIGGYGEIRNIYSRSEVFDTNKNNEPRRLHLGIDIWGSAGTPVFAPLGGMVHSFAFNNHYGDYGATIILLHQLDGIPFYTLYGHLALRNIEQLKEGDYICLGHEFAQFGEWFENGEWPPHLHFQIINDIEYRKGDYPGVCTVNEQERYLANCPNPDLILQMMQYAR